MTIEDLEAAHKASQPLDFRRHPLEAPDTTLQEQFYPMGFPVELKTNSIQVLDLCRAAWNGSSQRYDTEPIPIDVHVVESDSVECPPAPSFRMTMPLMSAIADADNYSLIDLARGSTQIVLSTAALRHPLYANYFFLESAASCHMVTRYATPVHGACVEWNGHGILLCGDSGAGKSTLSYACARAGFGYISDDATFILHSGDGSTVTGNSRRIRMRPEGAKLFPEIKDLEITPRAAGKPSVEISAGQGIVSLDETKVDYIVFLNRRSGREELLPYPRKVARDFMRQVAYGLPHQLDAQYNSIECILRAEVFEFHYSNLDWAVARLRQLAQAGR
jgi:hypothetical protein